MNRTALYSDSTLILESAMNPCRGDDLKMANVQNLHLRKTGIEVNEK